ncbi:MAG: 3-dehydroquinate synthase [Pirellulaceae bacterium]
MSSLPSNQTVRVQLAERSYDIHVGAETLSQIDTLVRSLRTVSHVVIITDTNCQALAQEIESYLCSASIRTNILTVPAGEPSKSAVTAADLWEQTIATYADRKSVIMAVGGGVVGDLAGFIAATFTRGIDFIQVPTTLLAQVDSSVGGKVGINLSSAKNMVGAFWQPRLVVIDTNVLSSLPDRDFRSGLAEVIKYGVILDEDFFSYLEANADAILQRDPSALTHIVARSCRLKADVVQQDERETTGLRAVLNYGHTFAHAFETLCGYGQVLHGEAVSIGMLCASRLAELLGRIDHATTQRQFDLIRKFGLPTEVPDISIEDAIAVMQKDKKVEHGRLRFVLPTRLGHVELVGDVDPQLVRQAMLNQ